MKKPYEIHPIGGKFKRRKITSMFVNVEQIQSLFFTKGIGFEADNCFVKLVSGDTFKISIAEYYDLLYIMQGNELKH